MEYCDGEDLASLLRGMQTRVDDQGEQIHTAVESLGQLPALNQTQIDVMRVMAERLEKVLGMIDSALEKGEQADRRQAVGNSC